MRILVFSIGKGKNRCWAESTAEYFRRAQRFAPVEHRVLKEQAGVEERILRSCEGKDLILFDERGEELSTSEFAHFLGKAKGEGRDLCFVIGGADGHSEHFRNKAHTLIALSRLTFPHELALLMASEALYRSLSVLANHPYHRE